MLIRKSAETNVGGATRAIILELAATRAIDTMDVAMIIVGSVVTFMLARYSASRTALPAMNWAPTAPEQIIAVVSAEPAFVSCGVSGNTVCQPSYHRRLAWGRGSPSGEDELRRIGFSH